MTGMETVIGDFVRCVEQTVSGPLRSVSLVGSWADGGLRPDSDIDLLLVTDRSLTMEERRELLDFLLCFSGRRASVRPGRPLEVTSLVLSDVVPWQYPPVCDFLYGEWLRDRYSDAGLPERHTNPDLALLIEGAREHAECLRGPHPRDVFVPVPAHDVRRSIVDGLEPLLDSLVGDERNVLLTLARMIVTLGSGRILPKDEAGRSVLPDLSEEDRQTLSWAVQAYLGREKDEWDRRQPEARAAAEHLAARVRDLSSVRTARPGTHLGTTYSRHDPRPGQRPV